MTTEHFRGLVVISMLGFGLCALGCDSNDSGTVHTYRVLRITDAGPQVVFQTPRTWKGPRRYAGPISYGDSETKQGALTNTYDATSCSLADDLSVFSYPDFDGDETCVEWSTSGVTVADIGYEIWSYDYSAGDANSFEICTDSSCSGGHVLVCEGYWDDYLEENPNRRYVKAFQFPCVP